MEMILYLAESAAPDIHLVFKRSQDTVRANPRRTTWPISLSTPPGPASRPNWAANHFRLPLLKLSLYHRLVALLRVVEYELGDRQITVHLGWPMSSWLDRLAIGVMVFNMMRLPRLFPNFSFIMSYTEPTGSASKIHAAAVK